MRKLSLHGWQVTCDRCRKPIEDAFFSLCEKCFDVPPESVRFRDFRFADCPDTLCAICGQERGMRPALEVCPGCASGHPDTSHSDFGRSEVSVASICSRCGSLQIVEKSGAGDTIFTYYRTGRKTPGTEPFACLPQIEPPLRQRQSSCAHEWIRVQSLPPEDEEPLQHDAARLFVSDEQVEVLEKAMRSGSSTLWCWQCGAIKHVSHTPVSDAVEE